MKKEIQNHFMIPGAILIAGLLIASAITYTGGKNKGGAADTEEKQVGSEALASAMRAVSDEDHILGNPSAPVKLIEFSDLECPFCKRFHLTLKQVVKEYVATGKVAIVYRHFPLESLHSQARREAEATECAASLGGNSAFWAFVDAVFEVTPSNNGLDLAKLPDIAEKVGLDRNAFNQCLTDGKFVDRVSRDLEDAASAGGRGTPYSVIVASNGEKFIISGAQPYSAVKETLEKALAAK